MDARRRRGGGGLEKWGSVSGHSIGTGATTRLSKGTRPQNKNAARNKNGPSCGQLGNGTPPPFV